MLPVKYWTPDFYVGREVVAAAFCVVAALEIGRSAMRPARIAWLRACRWAWLVLAPLAAVGFHGLATAGGVPRVGYRGLLVLDAAVAGLLAVVLIVLMLYELPRQLFQTTALKALLRYFIAQVVYLGAWEVSREIATGAGMLASAAYVWAMLDIGRVALARERWSGTRQPVRVRR